jgi:preprotein translocase subunit SecG
MLIALTVLFFLVSVLLILIVLIQPGGSGGIGFIGGGSQSAFGTKTGNVMTKFTTVLAALFLIVSFALGYLNARQSRVETEEMLDLKEAVEELPEGVQAERGVGEDIGVDISDTNE